MIDLQDVRGAVEHPDHYVIDHKHQGKFLLPKDGLLDEHHEQIRKIPGYAQGGVTGDDVVQQLQQVPGLGDMGNIPLQGMPSTRAAPLPPVEPIEGVPNANVRVEGSPAPLPSVPPLLAAPPADAAPAAAPAAVAKPKGASGDGWKPPDAGDVLGELRTARDKQLDAIENNGKAQKYAQDQYAVHQQAAADTYASAEADWKASRDAIAKQQQHLEEAVRNGHLDPNRIWGDPKSGGGGGSHMLATIGMALGAAGSSLAGGPNYAMKLIDDSINRDLEAQKLDLLNNKDQLEYYRKKGLDADDALKLRKANALDLAGAHIKVEAAKLGSKQAMNDAMVLGANVSTQAAKDRQDVVDRMITQHHQGQLLNSQLASAAQQRELGKLSIEGEKLRQRHEVLNMAHEQEIKRIREQWAAGGKIDPRDLARPEFEKDRESSFTDLGGEPRLALSKESGTAARETMEGARKLHDVINDMRAFNENDAGVSSGAGSVPWLPGTSASQKAESLISRATPVLNELAGLKRLSAEDIENIRKQLPNLGLRTDRSAERIKQLQDTLESAVTSALKTHTLNSAGLRAPHPMTADQKP